MKKILFACVAVGCLSAFVSCKNTDTKGSEEEAKKDTVSLVGKYTTFTVGDSIEMGVELKENGEAASINMETLPYDKWTKVNDSTVVIHGKSVFEGQETELNDTFSIDKEGKELNQHDMDIVYKKK
ncbi:lipocalin family protein [Prevotella sp. HUN102]|uniref:lipocalin family protein n=1 Tax=Prevotella sp. HUN102 TaxID=1392486 RepID=UPI00048DA782|nr:lipocalin family protein [Prevotella sp. HUN102]